MSQPRSTVRDRTITPRRPYWYRIHVGECPVCGRDASYRERVHDLPRPQRDEDRYVYLSDRYTYCGCVG